MTSPTSGQPTTIETRVPTKYATLTHRPYAK